MHISAEWQYLQSQILYHKPTFCNQTGLKTEESFLFGESKDSGEGLELYFALISWTLHFNLQKPKSQNYSQSITYLTYS